MIKIEFPDGSIRVVFPFGDQEVDDLIKMVRPLISGDAYVKFMDECLERIQDFLDWENTELTIVKPPVDEKINNIMKEYHDQIKMVEFFKSGG